MSLHIVKFRHIPAVDAYRCSEPGDASGDYVQAADAMDVIETLVGALEDCARFIVNDMPPNGGPEVAKAHEALMKYWRAKA